ncbi:hypothetical protein BJX62DRAFT_247308 [Aspergillus germanicus]
MKRVIQTSRSSSSYARKRAVTACQVCRARRTKCDQKKPRCSFCEQTGAECVSEPAGLSSFDPASIAILERLDGLDRKIEALAHETRTSSLLPGRLETVLAWPIFRDSASIPPLPTARELLTPGTRPPIAVNPILGDELNASATQEYLQTFLDHVLIKNPVLEETYIRRLSERELRLELSLADFSSRSSASTAPQRFPSLPPFTDDGPDDDDRMLRAWYFYLSEISLWRLEMEVRAEITACISKIQHAQGPTDKLLDMLCEVSEIYSQQAVAWQESLPPVVSISGSVCSDDGTDALRFILKGRKTYVNELITWPVIVHAIAQHSDLSLSLSLTPAQRSWLSKGVAAHLERLQINAPGFYHRHHGTWLMIRSSARSAYILSAVARSSAAVGNLLPSGWMAAVRETIDMLQFWSGEVVGLEGIATFCREELDKL